MNKINLTLDEMDFLIERGLSQGNELAVIRCLREGMHDYHRQLVEMGKKKQEAEEKYQYAMRLIAKGRSSMSYLLNDEDLQKAITAFEEGKESGFRGEDRANPYPESWYTGKCWSTGYGMGCSQREKSFDKQGHPGII